MCVSKTYENNDVKKTIVDTKFNMENDDSDDEVDASLMSSELFCEMSKMSSLDFLLLLFSLSSICCIHIYTTVNGDSIRSESHTLDLWDVWLSQIFLEEKE